MSASTAETTYVAVGRRKTATARVRLTRGTGKVQVNGRDADAYFKNEDFTNAALSPLHTVEMTESVDVLAQTQGGGLNGQAGAVRLGIARALEKLDSELRSPLKKEGHMKRDPRARERKKTGQPGARKNFQFSKR
ncbi:MAG: 30S ribosomal protein S9 [Opitutales bacterium]